MVKINSIYELKEISTMEIVDLRDLDLEPNKEFNSIKLRLKKLYDKNGFFVNLESPYLIRLFIQSISDMLKSYKNIDNDYMFIDPMFDDLTLLYRTFPHYENVKFECEITEFLSKWVNTSDELQEFHLRFNVFLKWYELLLARNEPNFDTNVDNVFSVAFKEIATKFYNFATLSDFQQAASCLALYQHNTNRQIPLQTSLMNFFEEKKSFSVFNSFDSEIAAHIIKLAKVQLFGCVTPTADSLTNAGLWREDPQMESIFERLWICLQLKKNNLSVDDFNLLLKLQCVDILDWCWNYVDDTCKNNLTLQIDSTNLKEKSLIWYYKTIASLDDIDEFLISCSKNVDLLNLQLKFILTSNDSKRFKTFWLKATTEQRNTMHGLMKANRYQLIRETSSSIINDLVLIAFEQQISKSGNKTKSPPTHIDLLQIGMRSITAAVLLNMDSLTMTVLNKILSSTYSCHQRLIKESWLSNNCKSLENFSDDVVRKFIDKFYLSADECQLILNMDNLTAIIVNAVLCKIKNNNLTPRVSKIKFQACINILLQRTDLESDMLRNAFCMPKMPLFYKNYCTDSQFAKILNRYFNTLDLKIGLAKEADNETKWSILQVLLQSSPVNIDDLNKFWSSCNGYGDGKILRNYLYDTYRDDFKNPTMIDYVLFNWVFEKIFEKHDFFNNKKLTQSDFDNNKIFPDEYELTHPTIVNEFLKLHGGTYIYWVMCQKKSRAEFEPYFNINDDAFKKELKYCLEHKKFDDGYATEFDASILITLSSSLKFNDLLIYLLKNIFDKDDDKTLLWNKENKNLQKFLFFNCKYWVGRCFTRKMFDSAKFLYNSDELISKCLLLNCDNITEYIANVLNSYELRGLSRFPTAYSILFKAEYYKKPENIFSLVFEKNFYYDLTSHLIKSLKNADPLNCTAIIDLFNYEHSYVSKGWLTKHEVKDNTAKVIEIFKLNKSNQLLSDILDEKSTIHITMLEHHEKSYFSNGPKLRETIKNALRDNTYSFC